MALGVEVDRAAIKAFCDKWRVTEFAFFGSILREDFGPESDIDVLITLAPSAEWDLFDWIEMRRELSEMFGRPVDLVEKTAIRNPYRRREILANHESVYVA